MVVIIAIVMFVVASHPPATPPSKNAGKAAVGDKAASGETKAADGEKKAGESEKKADDSEKKAGDGDKKADDKAVAKPEAKGAASK